MDGKIHRVLYALIKIWRTVLMSSKFTFYYGCMGSGKSLDLIRTAYNYKEKGLKFESI